MASSSSHVHQIKYDVFISFRGSDTRRGFLSHLTKELRQKRIDAYVDERLEGGDDISSSLLKAIEESVISLIIFSEDYASSKWCLEELVKIMQCKETNDQIVIPIFHNIDPSDVRHQKGNYRDAFAQHEQKFKDNMDKLQIWRSALNRAANLSGYHYPSNFENESQLIDRVVKDVLKKLNHIYPIEPKSLVGIDKKLACIESLWEIESKEVRIIGIWGMGGIGKTTLAHAICDKVLSQYESCCFLEKVREASAKKGLSCLLQELVDELLQQEDLHVNVKVKARFNMVIKRKLHQKKVLIVLDDVDTSEQLEYLVGELCLGPGSRVIVTSRDKHILISGGVHAIHEVEELNFQDSLQLFSLSAFKQSHPKIGYEKLSKRAVVYAKGIPLALKVLGLHFYSKEKKVWKSVLNKLQKHPNVDIQKVLKVSYDGLDDLEKNIFLDIAFFFKGVYKDHVIRVLDAFGFYATCGIDKLVDKALITISNVNTIEMHDLIKEMGEQIVREESINDPGRRSRLNDIEEVYDVLRYNKGSKAVQGIILDMSQIREVRLSADTFKKMKNMRFLKFHYGWSKRSSRNVILPSGFISLPNELRYFHWDGYPLKSLPLTFCPEKLVELCMEDSHVRKLWDGVQDFVNLRTINLRGSQQLMELPDFSKARNLEMVNLSYCSSLCNVHPSILSLHKLVILNLFKCKELKSLQSESHLKSLKHLIVDDCFSLKKFSLSSEQITSLYLSNARIEILGSSIGRTRKLRKLSLNGTMLKDMPINELSCLRYLEKLDIYDCKQLLDKPKLHILFRGLGSLQYLQLDGCRDLPELPDNISSLSSLKDLRLQGSSIVSLPASIKHLSNLEEIYLIDCKRLRTLPELPPFLTGLYAGNCTSLKTVKTSITSVPQYNINEKCFFSFNNCMELDEYSFIMEFAQLSMKGSVYNDSGVIHIWYPGSRVPEWFKYKQTKETSITIELTPPFDDFKDFLFCSVHSQFVSSEIVSPYLLCQCCVEDGEVVEYWRGWEYASMRDTELNSDHVFLWNKPSHFKCMLEEVKRRRGGNQGTADNPIKVSFKFCVVTYKDNTRVEHDGLIKASGVCPVYTSEYYSLLQQMELRKKRKRC